MQATLLSLWLAAPLFHTNLNPGRRVRPSSSSSSSARLLRSNRRSGCLTLSEPCLGVLVSQAATVTHWHSPAEPAARPANLIRSNHASDHVTRVPPT
eukprot:727227-Rhodomonas_salina.2